MEKRSKQEKAVAIGMVMGILIGALLDNIGVWLCIGIAVGAGIGGIQEKKENAEEPH